MSVKARMLTSGRDPAPGRAAADLSGLRARLAGGSAREAVLLDFLEDDLCEARSALASVAGWLDDVERVLGDPTSGRQLLLRLVLGRGPHEGLERLGGVLGNLRRRLAQVSARLPG